MSATRAVAYATAWKLAGAIDAHDVHQDILEWILLKLRDPERTAIDIANMLPTAAYRRAVRAFKGRDSAQFDYERYPGGEDAAEIYARADKLEPLNRALDLLKKKQPKHYWALVWFEGGYRDDEIIKKFREIDIDPGNNIREWRMRAKAFVKRELGSQHER